MRRCQTRTRAKHTSYRHAELDGCRVVEGPQNVLVWQGVSLEGDETYGVHGHEHTNHGDALDEHAVGHLRGKSENSAAVK